MSKTTQAKASRTFLVENNTLKDLCRILTGYGEIKFIDHEGTITFLLEGADDFELGRESVEIERELQSYDTSSKMTTAKGVSK